MAAILYLPSRGHTCVQYDACPIRFMSYHVQKDWACDGHLVFGSGPKLCCPQRSGLWWPSCFWIRPKLCGHNLLLNHNVMCYYNLVFLLVRQFHSGGQKDKGQPEKHNASDAADWKCKHRPTNHEYPTAPQPMETVGKGLKIQTELYFWVLTKHQAHNWPNLLE